MQSDPAIKAALDAATEGFCRRGDGLKCDPDPWCMYCQENAAAIVCAFLRALPAGACNLGRAGILTTTELADAVEAAAKEQRDAE